VLTHRHLELLRGGHRCAAAQDQHLSYVGWRSNSSSFFDVSLSSEPVRVRVCETPRPGTTKRRHRPRERGGERRHIGRGCEPARHTKRKRDRTPERSSVPARRTTRTTPTLRSRVCFRGALGFTRRKVHHLDCAPDAAPGLHHSRAQSASERHAPRPSIWRVFDRCKRTPEQHELMRLRLRTPDILALLRGTQSTANW